MQVSELSDFDGIYTRMTDPHCLPELKPSRRAGSDVERMRRAISWNDTFNAWLELAPQRVLNRTSATLSNFSKPYQLQHIRACGIGVPATLISNEPDLVRAFLARHGALIYKSTSSIRSIVRKLDTAALKKIDRIRQLPTQFQEYVPGDDVRVHVVGQKTFAVRIRSEAVDYRYAARDGLEADMQPMVLPAEMVEKCVALSKRLNLPLCGIDFKLTSAGRYVCFEVNPSPAYSYYEEQTGVAISAALVRYLAGSKTRQARENRNPDANSRKLVAA